MFRWLNCLLKADSDPNTKNERYPGFYKESNLAAMHFAFFEVRKKYSNFEKQPMTQIVDLLIKAGFTGAHNEILNSLNAQDLNGKANYDLLTSIWASRYNKYLENTYVQGATTGTFRNKLTSKLSAYIGTFLGRKEGGRLAQTCKQAAEDTNAKREGEAEQIRVKR